MTRMSRFFGVFALAIVPAAAILSVPGHAAAQEVAALQAELARAQEKVAKLEAQLAVAKAASDRGTADGDQIRKMVEVLRQQVAKLQEEMARLQVDRDRQLQERAALTDRLHKAQDELAQLKAENARLAARYRPRSESVARPSREGLVTGVSKEGLIEVSIGTDAGVLKGHTLYVYRVFTKATGYLGQVRVVESSPGKAVCEAIPATLSGRTVQKGDRVTATRQTPTPGEPPYLTDGRVLAVGKDGQLEISFGTDDGLWPGHRLEVYRLQGDEGVYVSRIEVVKTMPKKSICKSIIEHERHEVRKGDGVTTKL